MRARRRVTIHGRVQGVFFRDSARYEAEAAEVAGWVRNAEDGTVEAVFEGTPSAVDALVAYCGRGPERAHVERVDVVEEAYEGVVGFEVR